MTRQLNTPLIAVSALFAITLFMVASLISVGPAMDSNPVADIAAAPAAAADA